ncbi:MAG: phosphoribosyltransferase family protein [Clostridia bacterium]|jgi:ComF family protein|nr:phosphoribosyltransferase family protein [Clostridia bacterium]
MILEFIFGRYCIFCQAIISDGHMCSKCKKDLPYTDREVIKIKEDDNYLSVKSVFYYEDYIMDSIYRFKYKNRKHYAKYYARYMKSIIDNRFDVITYVPISKKRLKERGYNQAEVLAKELGKLINIEVKELIYRHKDTQKLRNKGVEARKNIIEGVFRKKCMVKGKKILLIDDIYTTGTTLNECSKVLNGNNVHCLTLACGKNTKKS